MPFQITWSRRERVKRGAGALREPGRAGVQRKREGEEERERVTDCCRDCEQFVKLRVISFRASIWQIDFVQRRFSHIEDDPAVITAIGLGADRQSQAQ